MNTQPIVLERTYKAPISKVWQAITDKDQMKNWYFDLADFKAEVGFEFSFIGKTSDGKELLHLSKVTEVIPGRKLTYSWAYEAYEGMSFVTFELFEEGDKTRLKLTHEGLHTFPQNNKDFAAGSFIQGWTGLIGKSLRNFVEADNTKDREIVTSRLLNAPKELVYEVWTKPEHVAKWYGPDGFTIATANMDVKTGGEWNFVMHGPDGTDYPSKMAFTEVVPNEKLEYIYGPGDPSGKGDFNVTVLFEGYGNQTMLTMHSVFSSAEEVKMLIEQHNVIEGGKQTMNKLEAYLAQQQ